MSSEKTEQPTDKKVREAREKGQVARSKHLSASASVLAAVLVFVGELPDLGHALLGLLRQTLTLTDVRPKQALLQAALLLARYALPVALAPLVVSLAAGAAQAGLAFHVEPLVPQLERLTPSLKKLFSVQSLIECGRSLAVALVLAAMVRAALRDAWPALAAGFSGGALPVAGLEKSLDWLRKAAWALFALGGLDLLYQRHRHQQELMMSRDEVKQEHKSSEGDPHQKAKRKKFAKELLAAAGAGGVKKATCVVVNPTHIAVALIYDAKATGSEAPVISASGADERAAAIREEARRCGVPIVKDIPLARTLVQLPIGEEVPEELYQAVAAVLKVAFEQQAEPQTQEKP
jgi:type III secretion protein U